MAAPLAQINADADALVAVVLDGFNLAMPHGKRKPAALGDLGLGGGRAAGPGQIEHLSGKSLQGLAGKTEWTAGVVGAIRLVLGHGWT